MADRDAEAFLRWCGDHGVTTRDLEIRTGGPQTPRKGRGLFLTKGCPAGAVLATVPFRLVFSAETVLLGMLPPSLPPAKALARMWMKRLRIAAGDPALRYLWLAAALAATAVSPRHRAPFLPYFRMLPKSVAALFSAPAAQMFPKLPPAEQTAFLDAQRHGDHVVSLTAAAFQEFAVRRRLTADVPQRGAIEWAYRTVMSRAIPIPIHCEPSAPQELLEFLAPPSGGDAGDDNNASDAPDYVPSLVPLIDLVNAPSQEGEGANCQLYTCEAQLRADGGAGGVAEKLIVIAAARPLAAGTELLMRYETSSPGASLYRFGFAPSS